MAFMANAKKLGASLATKAKALRHNLSEIEVKTLEATNEDPWGPHGSAMAGTVFTVPPSGHVAMLQRHARCQRQMRCALSCEQRPSRHAYLKCSLCVYVCLD